MIGNLLKDRLGHLLRDLRYLLKDQKHLLVDQGHLLKDLGYLPKDIGHLLKDLGQLLKEQRYLLKDHPRHLQENQRLLSDHQKHLLLILHQLAKILPQPRKDLLFLDMKFLQLGNNQIQEDHLLLLTGLTKELQEGNLQKIRNQQECLQCEDLAQLRTMEDHLQNVSRLQDQIGILPLQQQLLLLPELIESHKSQHLQVSI